MSALETLTDKPWLTPGPRDSYEGRPGGEPGQWDKGIGLALFLLVVAVLFTLIASAYLMRMGLHADHGGGDWRPLHEPALLWFNTILLAASSIAFRVALAGARRHAPLPLCLGTLGGGLLGIAFLIGQIELWHEYSVSTLPLALPICTSVPGDPFTIPIQQSAWGSPSLAFFYLISGLHGLHIVGGIAAWTSVGRRILAGGTSAQLARPAQLCARYWDFLLLVWLAMLGLFVLT